MSAADVRSKLEELRRIPVPAAREDFPRPLKQKLSEFIGVLTTVPIPVQERRAGSRPHEIGFADFTSTSRLPTAQAAARKAQRELVRSGYPAKAARVQILHVPAGHGFREAYYVGTFKETGPLTWEEVLR